MLLGSKNFFKKKEDFMEELKAGIKTTKVVLSKDERLNLKEKKEQVKSSYLKGFGVGTLVSMIALSNYSYLFSKSKMKIFGILAVGPVTFPLLWRIRQEYELQNYQLKLARKYLAKDQDDFD